MFKLNIYNCVPITPSRVLFKQSIITNKFNSNLIKQKLTLFDGITCAL